MAITANRSSIELYVWANYGAGCRKLVSNIDGEAGVAAVGNAVELPSDEYRKLHFPLVHFTLEIHNELQRNSVVG